MWEREEARNRLKLKWILCVKWHHAIKLYNFFFVACLFWLKARTALDVHSEGGRRVRAQLCNYWRSTIVNEAQSLRTIATILLCHFSHVIRVSFVLADFYIPKRANWLIKFIHPDTILPSFPTENFNDGVKCWEGSRNDTSLIFASFIFFC